MFTISLVVLQITVPKKSLNGPVSILSFAFEGTHTENTQVTLWFDSAILGRDGVVISEGFIFPSIYVR